MKKLVFVSLLTLAITLLLGSSVFGAQILSAECNKHGVLYPQGYNMIDETLKFSFIATGDTEKILINGGSGDSVLLTSPHGNRGKETTVGLETTNPIVSGVAGTRIFTFKAVGYDGSITPYDKEIVVECYHRDNQGLSILSASAERTVIKEVVAGHDTIEKLELTVATTLNVRDFIAVNELGEVIENVVNFCYSRGSCDIIDGIKYFKFYFISPIVGDRSFTLQAVDDYGNRHGQKVTVNYTVIADEKWDEYQYQGGAAGSGTQPGTDEGVSSGDDQNATGNEDGVQNGGNGNSDTDTNKGSENEGENPDNNNNQDGADSGGSCCKKEDFVSFTVPSSVKTIVIEFPDGEKYNAVDQEEKKLAKSEESEDRKEVTWDIWVGDEYKYEDLKVTVFDENYEPTEDYKVEETKPFTEEEIKEYELGITKELEIKTNPRQKIIKLEIGNEYMTVNGEKCEVDPGRGTKPLIVEGRTLLPIRAIIEALGGEIFWEAEEQRVQIKIFNKDIKFKIGSKDMTWNNIPEKIDVPPQIINSRTMLPVRFVAEALDHTKVEWDEKTRTVTITYNY